MLKHHRWTALLVAAVMFTVVGLGLAACGEKPDTYIPPAYAQAASGTTVVNVAPAAHDSGIKDMLFGGALGYMLGNSGSRAQPVQAPAYATHTTRVIERRVEVPAKPAAKPQAAPLWASAKPAAPTPAAKLFAPSSTPYRYSTPTPRVSYGSSFSRPSAGRR